MVRASEDGHAGPRRERDGPALTILLALWSLLCAAVLGALSIGHLVAFPEPEERAVQGLLTALEALRDDEDARFAVHVIASDCSCTESLFRHLLAHGPAAGADELILFVGPERGKRVPSLEAGYRFVNIDSARLAEMGLESAPVLALFDADARVQYLGGYYDHPSASRPLDLRLREALGRGEPVAPLPIYGCAVSERLREAFDPSGLLYGR